MDSDLVFDNHQYTLLDFVWIEYGLRVDWYHIGHAFLVKTIETIYHIINFDFISLNVGNLLVIELQ